MTGARRSKAGARGSRDALRAVDDRRVGKRKATATADKRMTRRERNAKKDPNKPKRPPSAFFVFLEEFRETFKSENPNVKAVSAVGKAAGVKWRAMSATEKTPYEQRAVGRKQEYEQLMNAYNRKQAGEDDGDGDDDELDKSKSEVDEASGEHQDEDEEDDEEEDDD